MATFITLIKFTPQGVTAIQDTYKRAAAFKAAAEMEKVLAAAGK